MAESITLQLFNRLYHRLSNTTQAIQRPLEEVIVRALEVGTPPDWDDVPEEFQADLAALDRLNDATLWQIAGSHKAIDEMTRYEELLELNQEDTLTDAQQMELIDLRKEAERFMLRKAQAAVILRWRRH